MRQNNSPRKHNIITGGARRDGRTDRRRTVVQPVGRLALPIASGASKAVHFRVPCFFGRLGCFQYGRIAEENRSLVTLSITCTYRQQGVDRQTDKNITVAGKAAASAWSDSYAVHTQFSLSACRKTVTHRHFLR